VAVLDADDVEAGDWIMRMPSLGRGFCQSGRICSGAAPPVIAEAVELYQRGRP
jgi:hypothetical protein